MLVKQVCVADSSNLCTAASAVLYDLHSSWITVGTTMSLSLPMPSRKTNLISIQIRYSILHAFLST